MSKAFKEDLKRLRLKVQRKGSRNTPRSFKSGHQLRLDDYERVDG